MSEKLTIEVYINMQSQCWW